MRTIRLTVRSSDSIVTREVGWDERLQLGNIKLPDPGKQPDYVGSSLGEDQGEDQGTYAGVEIPKGKLAIGATRKGPPSHPIKELRPRHSSHTRVEDDEEDIFPNRPKDNKEAAEEDDGAALDAEEGTAGDLMQPGNVGCPAPNDDNAVPLTPIFTDLRVRDVQCWRP